ncbi:MAG: hypothetical protein OEZ58_17960 [Gammaproteobacteria bacterium]|nr:hypothetical protein [Gammaproteobacteria bacterium]
MITNNFYIRGLQNTHDMFAKVNFVSINQCTHSWDFVESIIRQHYPDLVVCFSQPLTTLPTFTAKSLIYLPELACYIRDNPNYHTFYYQKKFVVENLSGKAFVEAFCDFHRQFQIDFKNALIRYEQNQTDKLKRLCSRVVPIVIDSYSTSRDVVCSVVINGITYGVNSDYSGRSTTNCISLFDYLDIEPKYNWVVDISSIILGTDMIDIRHHDKEKKGRPNWIHMNTLARASLKERNDAA